MNKKTLQKALDELNKENPKIDYVRGMLEVLLDDDTVPPAPATPVFTPKIDTTEPPLPNGVMIGKRPINA